MNVVTEVVLPSVIATIMLGMGMTLTPADFGRVFKRPRAILTGMVSLMLVVPLIGFGLASVFPMDPVLAMGLVLLATCPGGMLSNLMTHIGGGDLALSITLTALVSTAYVFAIPFVADYAMVTFIGEAQQIRLPVGATLGKLFLITLAPVIVGMLIRYRVPRFAGRLERPVSYITGGFLILIFVVLLADQGETLLTSLGQVAMPVVILNLSAMTVAFMLTRITRLSRRDTIAVVVEHSIRQEGTAIYIAVTLLGSAKMSLPLLLNAVVGMTLTLIFVGLVRSKRGLLLGAPSS